MYSLIVACAVIVPCRLIDERRAIRPQDSIVVANQLRDQVRVLFDEIVDSERKPLCLWYLGHLEVTAGNISGAMEIAEQIPQTYSWLRASLSNEIIEAVANRRAQAGISVETIREPDLGGWWKDSFADSYLSLCGIAHAKRQDWSGLDKTVALLKGRISETKDGEERYTKILKLTKVFIAAMKFNDVRTLLEQIPRDELWLLLRDVEVKAAALKAADAGDLENAVLFRNDLHKRTEYISVTLAIAAMQWRMGLKSEARKSIEDAIALTREQVDQRDEAESRSDIAVTLARIGDLEEALMALPIYDFARNQALVIITGLLAESGDADGARKVSDMIGGENADFFRDQATAAMAVGLAKFNDFDGAWQVLRSRRIKRFWDRHAPLRTIAMLQAMHGCSRQALKQASELPDSLDRGFVLAGISEGLMKLGSEKP